MIENRQGRKPGSDFRCLLVVSLAFDPTVVLMDSGEDHWFVGVAPPAAPCDYTKQEAGVPAGPRTGPRARLRTELRVDSWLDTGLEPELDSGLELGLDLGLDSGLLFRTGRVLNKFKVQLKVSDRNVSAFRFIN